MEKEKCMKNDNCPYYDPYNEAAYDGCMFGAFAENKEEERLCRMLNGEVKFRRVRSMYESPIKQILGEMKITYENECMKAVQSVGFDVNKEELIKALMYDRNQYEKGCSDGYNNAIDDVIKVVNSTLIFETISNRYIDRDLLYKKLKQLRRQTEFQRGKNNENNTRNNIRTDSSLCCD